MVAQAGHVTAATVCFAYKFLHYDKQEITPPQSCEGGSHRGCDSAGVCRSDKLSVCGEEKPSGYMQSFYAVEGHHPVVYYCLVC